MISLHCTRKGPGRRHNGKRFHITGRDIAIYPQVRADKQGSPHGVPGAKLLRAAINRMLALLGYAISGVSALTTKYGRSRRWTLTPLIE